VCVCVGVYTTLIKTFLTAPTHSNHSRKKKKKIK